MAMLSLQVAPSEERRAVLFARLCNEGSAAALLYDHAAPTFDNWLGITAPENAWCVEGMVDEQSAGVAWCNGFTGKSAFIHFAAFRQYSPLAAILGRYVCKWAFSSGLEALLGLTPAPYRHALAAVRKMGFVEQFRIPGACHIARYGRYVPGVVSMLTKQQYDEVRS